MAKAFRDLLADAGYGASRADNPQVLRERIKNPPGLRDPSRNASGATGPSTLVQDDFGPLVQDLLPPSRNNIETSGVIETLRVRR